MSRRANDYKAGARQLALREGNNRVRETVKKAVPKMSSLHNEGAASRREDVQITPGRAESRNFEQAKKDVLTGNNSYRARRMNRGKSK